MEEYKEQGDDQHIHQANNELFQPQQNSVDSTENVKSPSDLRLFTDHTKSMPQISQQNVGNCPTLETSTTSIQKRKWQRKGATRIAGFMFWTNTAAVVLLLIGFVSPGWLTVKTSQQVINKTYSPYGDVYKVKYIDVYQDYALWYFTQCKYPDGEATCQTITYRSCGTKSEAEPWLYFSEAVLVFRHFDLVIVQSLYTVGLVLELLVLCVWYTNQNFVAEDKITDITRLQWRCLPTLFLTSALLLVFVSVVIWISKGLMIGSDDRSDIKTPVGVVFAGFGCGIMFLCQATFSMLMAVPASFREIYIYYVLQRGIQRDTNSG